MNGSLADGMRFLGAHPMQPADDVERVLMVKLSNRINKLYAQAAKKAQAG